MSITVYINWPAKQMMKQHMTPFDLHNVIQKRREGWGGDARTQFT
jgi:hypothetical protein